MFQPQTVKRTRWRRRLQNFSLNTLHVSIYPVVHCFNFVWLTILQIVYGIDEKIIFQCYTHISNHWITFDLCKYISINALFQLFTMFYSIRITFDLCSFSPHGQRDEHVEQSVNRMMNIIDLACNIRERHNKALKTPLKYVQLCLHDLIFYNNVFM